MISIDSEINTIGAWLTRRVRDRDVRVGKIVLLRTMRLSSSIEDFDAQSIRIDRTSHLHLMRSTCLSFPVRRTNQAHFVIVLGNGSSGGLNGSALDGGSLDGGGTNDLRERMSREKEKEMGGG